MCLIKWVKMFCIFWLLSSFCVMAVPISLKAGNDDNLSSVKSGTTEFRFFEITPILRDHLEDAESAIKEAALIGFRVEKTGYGITGSGRSGRYRAWVIMSRDLVTFEHQQYEYLVLKSNDSEAEINTLRSSLTAATANGFEVRGILSNYENRSSFNPRQICRTAIILERRIAPVNRRINYRLFSKGSRGSPTPLEQLQNAGYRLLDGGITFVVGWREGESSNSETSRLEYKEIPSIKKLGQVDVQQQRRLDLIDMPGCRLETSEYILACNSNDKTRYDHKVVPLADLLRSQAEWQALVHDGFVLRIVYGGPFQLFAGFERDPTTKNNKTANETQILYVASFEMDQRKQLDDRLATGYQIDNVLITETGGLVLTLERKKQTGH